MKILILEIKPPRPIVRRFLEKYLLESGILDATLLVTQMNDDELCEFFSQYARCPCFHLRRLFFLICRVFAITCTISVGLISLIKFYDVYQCPLGNRSLKLICRLPKLGLSI